VERDYILETSKGYVRVAAGGVNTAVTLQTLVEAAGLTLTDVLIVRIIPETQAIRWRDDGTAPTAAIGMPLAAGDELVYTGRNPEQLSVIAQVAGAVLNIAMFG